MNKLNQPIKFRNGSIMENRFMLAPLTNRQSHEDGTLSEDEFNWLTMRAKGGFGLVMTCASHVQANGKGFPGQLGIFSDDHIPGHTRLAEAIKSYGSLAVIQLHHAGMRSPEELIDGKPMCPSDNEKHGARGLSLAEMEGLRDDFIEAAVRAKKCGYDGVEVHGAHGYILTQFLSKKHNKRNDEYGGSFENRARIIVEIVDGIREKCGEEFLLGLRLSPERFGMELEEIKPLSQQFADSKKIDFLDISLWDVFKKPEGEEQGHKTLMAHFAELNLGDTKLTVAGKIATAENVHEVMNSGVDFVTIGKGGILHHDFPQKVMENPSFATQAIPVSVSYLKTEGLGDAFVEYMRRWPGFVAE